MTSPPALAKMKCFPIWYIQIAIKFGSYTLLLLSVLNYQMPYGDRELILSRVQPTQFNC